MISIRLFRAVLFCLIAVSAPLVTTHAAMSTTGQFSVSENGAASYTIPIAVPPGTAGIEPKLAFGYSSQGGNNLLGIGWSLNGLSAITRCPQTQAQDSSMKGINYDINDRYCLDGQRLILTNGTYGKDGAEYRTERESFSKIVSYGSAGNGPAWFKVWTKSGQIIEYGNTSDSRIEAQGNTTVRLWTVNKLQDTNGNYLTVSYTEDAVNGDFYPLRIDYTYSAKTAQTSNNSVQFQYEARPVADITPLYQAGSLIKSVVRLSKVQTYTGTSLVKEYRLAYDNNGSVGGSRLVSLQECAVSECLSPVAFSWEANNSFNFQLMAQQTSPSYSDNIYFGDFNGDGKTDLFVTSQGGTWAGWKMFLSTGNDFVQSATGSWPSYGENFYFGDFNGDGKTDFLVTAKDSSSGWVGWKAFLSTGSGFVESANGSWPSYGENFYLGDFNGDGKTDLLVTSKDGAWVGWKALLSTGNGFTQSATGSWPSYGENFYLGDFNGDGKTDFMVMAKGPAAGWTGWKVYLSSGSDFVQSANDSWPSYGEDVYFGDFNGDGKIDFMVAAKSGSVGWSGWKVYLSTGSGFVQSATGSWPSYGENFYFGDFNGDGKTDFMVVAKSGSASWTGWKTFLSTGNGFVQSAIGNWPSYGENFYIGEFNGDGKSDFLTTAKTSSAGWAGWKAYVAGEAYKGDRVNTITNSLQQATQITYAPLTNNSVYTKDNDANAASSQIDLQIPLYVASSVVSSNGIGGVLTTNYKYGGLKSEMTGRGLLGFRWIQSTQVESNLTNRTEYRQDWPYVGLPSLVKKTIPSGGNGGLLSQVSNTFGCIDFVSASGCTVAAGKRYFPFVSQSVESSWDLNGSALPTVTTTTQYDTWGNATQVNVSTSDGYSKTNTNTYSNDVTNWFLGRLTGATVTSTMP